MERPLLKHAPNGAASEGRENTRIAAHRAESNGYDFVVSRTLFLSTVSSEFGALRRRIARVLERGKSIHLRHGEDFVQRGVLTLQMLEEEIRDSDVVLHLIGSQVGSTPPIDQVTSLLERLHQFEQLFPDVAEVARRGQLTYTQWEAWLAIYFDRPLCIYYLEESRSQSDHYALLRDHDIYPKRCKSTAELYDEMLATLIEIGYLTRDTAYKPIHLPFGSMGDLFKGRDDFLNDLRASLLDHSGAGATAIVGAALYGLGGIGKTRLAVEYAWKHVDDYSALLFVTADSPQALRMNLAELCGPLVLNLPEQSASEQEVRMSATLRWMEKNTGWLLILDNLDTEEAASAAESLLARLSDGHVVLTSRLADWSGKVNAMELDVLPLDDAVNFLLQRTAGRRRAKDDDDQQAQEIATDLGRLPVALEQAGAYIGQRKMTLAQYRKTWNERRDKAIDGFDDRAIQYPHSVIVTWQTTIEQLSPPAFELLARLAWFGPEPIPESILESAPAAADERVDWFKALVELDLWSLVSRATAEESFSVHRLVQDVARRDPQQTDHGQLRKALEWMNAAFTGDPGDVRDWEKLDPLSPHVQVLVKHADDCQLSEPTANLMGRLGFLSSAKAIYDEAERLRRRALEIDQHRFGVDSTEAAHRMSELATTLQETGRLAEAEPLMERALAIDEAAFGGEHPRVAVQLNNLAQLLRETGRLAEAEPLMERALAIDEAAFGGEHPRVAVQLNNLAQLLRETGRLAEAEPLMERALAIDEQCYGKEHPRAAIDLNNLAQLLKATNRLSEAEPLMERALAIDEAAFGGEHPNVAIRLNNLALLFANTNRLAEAESLMRRAAAIFKDSLGSKHPNTLSIMHNLQALLKRMEASNDA